MLKLLELADIDLRNKRVLLRVDYNVVENKKIIDEFRIRASLPTIKYLLGKGCSVILISHNGRPNGKRVEGLSLRPVAKVLPRLLGTDVAFLDDCIGQEVQDEVSRIQTGDVMLLENLRFHKGEESNSKLFAKQLANLAEVYIDDAFGAIHRAHASIVGVPKLLPHAAGMLVQKEYSIFAGLMQKPIHPYAAVVGGAKISDKIEVLKNLLNQVDVMLIGGAMANTFLAAQGNNMQKSLVENSSIASAKKILALANQKKVKIITPLDVVVSKSIKSKLHQTVLVSSLRAADIALDIGPSTIVVFEHVLKVCKTIFWNGTLGMAEINTYAKASKAIAKTMIDSKAKTVVGGGDTVTFVDYYHLNNKFGFVSTGGGASLELLAGKTLPGLAVLAKQ